MMWQALVVLTVPAGFILARLILARLILARLILARLILLGTGNPGWNLGGAGRWRG